MSRIHLVEVLADAATAAAAVDPTGAELLAQLRAPASAVELAGSRRVESPEGQLPHPGILELATFDHGGATVVVRGYLYGPGGDQVAAREAPRWTSWLLQQVNGFAALT